MSSQPRRAEETPIVVTPLRFERRALLRAGLSAVAALECCGPGAASVSAWARSIGASRRTVVLAGLAGALHDDHAAGHAFAAASVRDESGAAWTPTMPGEARRVIVSVTDPVVSADAKAALARRSGADAVDLESAAFAEAAVEHGWRWGVVRGIGDDSTSRLPEGVGGWVDEHGATRAGVVLRDLLRHPGDVATVIALRRDGRAALGAVAALLREMLAAPPDA